MESPEGGRVIPPIVEQEGVEHDAALLVQLGAVRGDHGERVGFAVLGEVADVVPRVVVQEGAVGVRALALDVRLEIAPQLAGAHHASHRAHGEWRRRPQGEFPGKTQRARPAVTVLAESGCSNAV